MSDNKSKVLCLIAVSFMVIGSLSGCGKGKEQAAVALDEARLKISDARKAGATLSSPALREAEAKLQGAEQSFKKGEYKPASTAASQASALAVNAKSAAANAKSEAAKQTAGSKIKRPRKKGSKPARR